jgi:hypothetical protein
MVCFGCENLFSRSVTFAHVVASLVGGRVVTSNAMVAIHVDSLDALVGLPVLDSNPLFGWNARLEGAE